MRDLGTESPNGAIRYSCHAIVSRQANQSPSFPSFLLRAGGKRRSAWFTAGSREERSNFTRSVTRCPGNGFLGAKRATRTVHSILNLQFSTASHSKRAEKWTLYEINFIFRPRSLPRRTRAHQPGARGPSGSLPQHRGATPRLSLASACTDIVLRSIPCPGGERLGLGRYPFEVLPQEAGDVADGGGLAHARAAQQQHRVPQAHHVLNQLRAARHCLRRSASGSLVGCANWPDAMAVVRAVGSMNVASHAGTHSRDTD